MGSTHNYLAIDLGAESGRVILGTLVEDHLSLMEAHRFANIPVRLPDGLHWDVLRLWSEIKSGISAAVSKYGKPLDAIGLDTWGVDFALLDREGALLANPFHYRDSRTDGMYAEAFRRMTRETIFENTGIQFMQFNTLYQLLAMVVEKSPLLEVAQTLLTIPDLYNYWLTGKITCEFTTATTTQCFDPHRRDWAHLVLRALGIPEHLFQPVIEPGTVIDGLDLDVANELGASRIPVVAPACHDTGSAVVAIPAEGRNFAWISSGTWSILGVEVDQPVVTEQTLKDNFTNEGGVFGKWRLSKNVMGLWLLQECRRAWVRQGEELSYDEITRMASEARPFQSIIDPDFGGFLHPDDMPDQIRQYCISTGQPVPQDKGELIRSALESIALKYRWVLERLDEITGTRFELLHIIGGGTQNRLLNQFTADATQCNCLAGPVEATALGNVLMQGIALGHIESLERARNLVRTSFPPSVYLPGKSKEWDQAYVRLLEVISR
ncbi:MAG: rhamnulokinase family protein [Anaerolineales bacterium]|jgi:rhamnulokinase